ncbi:unnamed protein product [Moneuplotes crassus]|uniref:RAP domain-containing protein n=2 Tax=Euplotes crassus TaxID=5936 RepID=A0AAD1U766_EUPCR|nr:unnamed protein product [Moneuplotes crassus]
MVRQTFFKPLFLHQVHIRSFCMASSYPKPYELSLRKNSHQSIPLLEMREHQMNQIAMEISQEELSSILDNIDTSPSLSVEPLWKVTQMLRHSVQRRHRVDMSKIHYEIMNRIINMTEHINKEELTPNQAIRIFRIITYLLINESMYFRKKTSRFTLEQMNALDKVCVTTIRAFPNLPASDYIGVVIKLMVNRMDSFRDASNSTSVVQWYFRNIFGRRVTSFDINRLSDFSLTQIVLSMSFLNYDLSQIESHLKVMKNNCLSRIKKRADKMNTKQVVQILSSLLRMKIIFIKDWEDMEEVVNVIEGKIDSMNLLDLQSVLKGYSEVYAIYSYPPKTKDRIIQKLKECKEPMTSLILTNIMRSLNALRIDDDELYSHIVMCVKRDYQRLDNIALIYTFSRLIKLNQLEKAKELFEFYMELGTFEELENPHNIAQMLLSFAILKIYDEDLWNSLIEKCDYQKLMSIKPSANDNFTMACEPAFQLLKNEAPELYKKNENCALLQRLKQYHEAHNAEITKTQMTISRACQLLGYEVINETYINEVSVDIYLPKINLIIEYNGPTHYMNGTNKLVGSSLYKERLINFDCKILQLGYFEISKCKDLNLSRLFLGDAPESLMKQVKEYDRIADLLKERIDAMVSKKTTSSSDNPWP